MNETATDNRDSHTAVRFYCFIFAIVLCAVALGGFYCDQFISGRTEMRQSLTVAINPNTAEVASLVRLPGIGPARARDIVAYRNSSEVDKPAFKCAGDMEKIKGIGPKTVEKLLPYLCFD